MAGEAPPLYAPELLRFAGLALDGAAGNNMGMLQSKGTKDDTFNFFLWEMAKEAMRRAGHKLPIRTKFVERIGA